ENIVTAFGIHPRADMKYAPRKLPDMEGGEVMESFSVGRQNLDTNHHVNNAQYVAMAMECLPRGIKPVELLVEYKKQAYLGDIITPVVQRTEDGYAISLRASGGDPYANLRLRTG
ncbi:MAG TPA: acyl-[acyl-carrier-protein] thioesterase, partial [Lachnospiraceae bacterium]|nr:acyl-[acyl-carrier-protein] thioesterase [Lachnospiraceae bacterium]